MVQSNSPSANIPDLRRTGIDPDFWYPVALSKDLKPKQATPVDFAGEAIVVVRTAQGKVFALEDRCAHRQMPLHMGVVDGERIRCGYHAWCFDQAGTIRKIPYLPKGAKLPRGVRSFPCREAYGLIFAFPGDAEKADHVELPQLSRWGTPAYKTMYFSRLVNCHYSFMHENLMDMNHQFLHRKLMGRIRPIMLEEGKGDHWVEVRYRFERVGGKQAFGANFMLGDEDPDTSNRDFDIMTIRTEYPYQMLSVRRPSQTEPSLDLWTAYVPVDAAQRSNRSFGLLMLKKPRIPGLINVFWPAMRLFTERVFAEDRMAVEAEQRAHDRQGKDLNQEIFPVILDLRDLLLRRGKPM